VNVALWLSRAARERPDSPALFRGARPWIAYGPLAARVARLAGGLRHRLGLAPGERVALVMRNGPEYLVAAYAAWWAGLAAVPVNAKLHPREVGWILDNAGARAVVVTPEWEAGLGEAMRGLARPPEVLGAERLERFEGEALEAPAARGAGDLAWLFYTSGTTGRPKGAMLSHRNLAQMTLAYLADVDAVPREGRLLHAAPLSHGSGLYTFTHLVRGAAQVVPESGGFDAEEVLDLLAAHREVSFFAAPTIVKRLVERGRATGAAVPGLRTLVYGGGPMYLADIEAALALWGPRFAQIYGQGESPMTISTLSKAHHAESAHPRFRERLASVGLPHSVVEVEVRDGAGRPCAPGEVGEVCVRGDVVMSGYWGNPEASAEALRGGWLHTGDLGALDAEGFLALRDRSKDLIVSGGSNIYPREVEEVLLRHPAVAEASVVGRPDPEWGEVVVAFVVARGGQPPREELDRLCLDHIARFKRPKEYRFVEALPKNNYGKVVKSELRQVIAAEARGGIESSTSPAGARPDGGT
jgi:long-chain acyl-CoA synthetase